MRVVFDSNILISALVFPGKQAERALLRIIEGRDELVLSKPIIDEVLWVLARKFAREPEEIARVAVLLAELGDIVGPKLRIKELKDEPDNRVLECAVSGAADLIVTGNQNLLKLGTFRAVRLLSLRIYLES